MFPVFFLTSNPLYSRSYSNFKYQNLPILSTSPYVKMWRNLTTKTTDSVKCTLKNDSTERIMKGWEIKLCHYAKSQIPFCLLRKTPRNFTQVASNSFLVWEKLRCVLNIEKGLNEQPQTVFFSLTQQIHLLVHILSLNAFWFEWRQIVLNRRQIVLNRCCFDTPDHQRTCFHTAKLFPQRQ